MRWKGIFPSGVRQPYGGDHPRHGPRGPFSGVFTDQPVFAFVEGLGGAEIPVYGLYFIDLLNHAIMSGYIFHDDDGEREFLTGDTKVMSKKQKRFWLHFASQANAIPESALGDEYGEIDYGDMDKAFIAFDHFLGSYGVKHEHPRP